MRHDELKEGDVMLSKKSVDAKVFLRTENDLHTFLDLQTGQTFKIRHFFQNIGVWWTVIRGSETLQEGFPR